MSIIRYTVDGGAILDSSYQMSNALASKSVYNHYNLEWEKEFFKFCIDNNINAPKPVLYKGGMFFYGGLRPLGSVYNSEHQDILFGIKKTKRPVVVPKNPKEFKFQDEEIIKPYYIVADVIELKQPNDEQYAKYFKKIIESKKIKISDRDKEGITYIILNKKSYFSFDTTLIK